MKNRLNKKNGYKNYQSNETVGILSPGHLYTHKLA